MAKTFAEALLRGLITAAEDREAARLKEKAESEAAKDGWIPLSELLKKVSATYAEKCAARHDAQAQRDTQEVGVAPSTGGENDQSNPNTSKPKPDYKNNPFVCILVGDEPSYGNVPDLMIAVKKGHAEHGPFDLPPGTRVAVARIVGFIDQPDVPQPVFAPLRDL